MNQFFYLLLGSLATFRLALLISHEQGPMRIFDKLRRLPPPKSNARAGLSCQWCMGIWSSSLVTTALYFLGIFPGNEWPIWWLAISAGSVVWNQAFIANK